MAEAIYNLDDTSLIERLEESPPTLGKISCLFTAIPSEVQKDWDLRQYGHVDHESNLLLLMRLDPQDIDLVHEIKQAWVSKYLPSGVVCMVTLNPPVPDQKYQVRIERFGPNTITCRKPSKSQDRRQSQDSQSTKTEKSFAEPQATGGEGETANEDTGEETDEGQNEEDSRTSG
ncbi:hypothetical protein F4809DRAFT_642410 [Biscogniauxia mediterranea]|nr:hypothetical protein F4809DRAFT_642410 [Biscogniauxia mediterranea]